jgi:hypothetical protein
MPLPVVTIEREYGPIARVVRYDAAGASRCHRLTVVPP